MNCQETLRSQLDAASVKWMNPCIVTITASMMRNLIPSTAVARIYVPRVSLLIHCLQVHANCQHWIQSFIYKTRNQLVKMQGGVTYLPTRINWAWNSLQTGTSPVLTRARASCLPSTDVQLFTSPFERYHFPNHSTIQQSRRVFAI